MAFCFMFVLCFIDMLCPVLCGTVRAARQLGTRPKRAFRPLSSFLLIPPQQPQQTFQPLEMSLKSPHKGVYLEGGEKTDLEEIFCS